MLTAVGLNAENAAPSISRRREFSVSKRHRPCPGWRGVRCPQRPPECRRAEGANKCLVLGRPRGEGVWSGCGHGRQAKCWYPTGATAEGTGQWVTKSCWDARRCPTAFPPVAIQGSGRDAAVNVQCLLRGAGGKDGVTCGGNGESSVSPQPAGPRCAPGWGRAGSVLVQGPFRGAEETGCDSCPNPRIRKKKPFLSAETHASNFNFPDD